MCAGHVAAAAVASRFCLDLVLERLSGCRLFTSLVSSVRLVVIVGCEHAVHARPMLAGAFASQSMLCHMHVSKQHCACETELA